MHPQVQQLLLFFQTLAELWKLDPLEVIPCRTRRGDAARSHQPEPSVNTAMPQLLPSNDPPHLAGSLIDEGQNFRGWWVGEAFEIRPKRHGRQPQFGGAVGCEEFPCFAPLPPPARSFCRSSKNVVSSAIRPAASYVVNSITLRQRSGTPRQAAM
jgi:hypothetical protein